MSRDHGAAARDLIAVMEMMNESEELKKRVSELEEAMFGVAMMQQQAEELAIAMKLKDDIIARQLAEIVALEIQVEELERRL